MKTIISAYRRRLALALFVLAAGLCYSCGPGRAPDAVLLSSRADAVEGSAAAADHMEAADGSHGAGSSDPAAELVSGLGQISSSKGKECYVHVCGEVAHPGVYRLTEGQRVFEAVELAGGFTDAAADTFLNLAEPVFDGMKVEVPDREQAAQMPAGQEKQSQSAEQNSGKVNLNTATREELMTLRGIGQAKAEDILAYREQYGGFGRIEEIMKVPGIKEAAFQKIRDDITV